MSRKTKKELILETFLENGFSELTDKTINIINSRLVEIYGRGAVASAAYIAQTLINKGQKVYFLEQLDISGEIESFANSLHTLSFDTLADAEKSILLLDNYFHQSQREGNEEGVFYCKDFARRAKLRAKLISENEKLTAEKRKLKQEVAFWFEIWLATPEIFKDWLILRKSSKDFQKQFGIEIE
ncbi:MAG: hypothetical protein HY819_04315 [Acidobacteria bacterium]|nr:hypothetical protein [Acidobacteriota bacterium]